MQHERAVTRRGLLKGAAAALSAPYVVTSPALGAADRPAASERVVMGCIGVGGQGWGVGRAFLGRRDVQMVAVCDVNDQRAQRAKDQVDARYGDKACKTYRDFRRLVARGDIDAVVVGTPDHGHVLPVIAAARAGKDIYCEKPLSLTVAEGRAMSDAVRRYGRVFQHGTQQRSDGRFRFACELARNGRIGRLQRVIVAVPGGRRSDMPAAQPVPDWFDYDKWLGPSPWAPFSTQRITNSYWYHAADYTAGFVSGWGVHHIDIAQWGLGTELGGPVEIEGRGDYPETGLCDAAVTWRVELTYANGVKVLFTDNRANPQGVRFEGTDGWVYVRRGSIDAGPKSLLRETIGPNEIHLYDSRSHTGNLIDCIRTRQPTVAAIEAGHRSNTICLISDIAMRVGRKLRWDPAAERFGGDDEANRMLARAMREPWRL